MSALRCLTAALLVAGSASGRRAVAQAAADTTLVGEYGPDAHPLLVREVGGRLELLADSTSVAPLARTGRDAYRLPSAAPWAGAPRAGATVSFERGPDGRASSVAVGSAAYPRRALPADDDRVNAQTPPVRPPAELRVEALAATPPVEQGDFRRPELVEARDLDPTIRYDIRYATSNNFMGVPFYSSAHAFLQRPAAEAVARASAALRPLGYGLLVHDAYRPWYVTKMFWDGTPPDKHVFVANPAEGSRHNRGAAVDITLYDLRTGAPVRMTGGYDETTTRSYARYPGGTTGQRAHRDLLRRAMEAEGFAVYPEEWWHFDYRDWRRYPIGTLTFEQLAARGDAGRGDAGRAGAAGDSAYDVVIRNGRVLDGRGNPWVRADVAIRGGRFVRIGVVDGRGRTEIDAAGRYVSPGWIDMLDQSGEVLAKNGHAENKLREGVTTAIAGEAGTPVPAAELGGYLAGLERRGISMNFGTSYSETQARVAVVGQSARAPNAGELARMRAIVDTAMRNGALGITTALIYPPASYSTTDEIAEVAKAAARYGGVYGTHVRGEGRDVVRSVNEAITIGARAGLPVEIFHVKVAYKPGWGVLMDSVGRAIEAARARGQDVTANMYLYTAGGTTLAATVPSWAAEGGADSLRARLGRHDVRARLKRELVTGSPGWWNIVEAAGGWDNIVLAESGSPANAKYEGQSIAQVARATGKDPADAAWDIVAQAPEGTGALYHLMSEQDVETALRFPWTSIGSDASGILKASEPGEGAHGHPRAYGNFPRVIAHYVRERRVIPLADAVRKMSGWPATRMHLAERGTISVGNWADVTIFDYDAIQDRATYEHPAEFPAGIDYVLVNGVVTVDHGRHTGATAGRILWGPGWTGAARP